jgi:hypothetical protein
MLQLLPGSACPRRRGQADKLQGHRPYTAILPDLPHNLFGAAHVALGVYL